MTLGIRGTLIVGLAGLLFAAGAIAAWVVVTLTADETLKQVEAQLEHRADGLAALAAARGRDGRAALARWLGAQQQEQLVQAAVFDGSLQPIAGQGRAADVPAVGDALQGKSGPGARVPRDADHARGAGLDYRVARRINLEGERAALGLVFSLDAVRQSVATRQAVVLWSLAFDVVALLLFGVYLATRTLVRPVQALTRATQAIASGQGGAEQVPSLTGPSELQGLAEAFRTMIERLAAQRAELQATIGALEAARDELVRSEKLATVGRLAAGVAHEVGNPLAAVVGYLDYLQAGKGDAELRADLFKRTRKELERIRTTVRLLLDFSRPAPDRPARVRLGDVARSAAELSGYHQSLKHVELVVEGQAPAVRADPARLRQVFVNLLLNAGQAQGGQGAVRVELGTDDGLAWARVVDEGPGVPPDAAAELFEPFFTTRDQGTGLGLAISLRIVEAAGGTLRLLPSAPGQGAVFEVRLPAASEEDGLAGELPDQAV